MKRFILSLAIGIATLFSLNSCAVGTYAETDIPLTEDISLVVRFGTPYYFEGDILYYLYDGWYYYPYTLGGRHYYYKYARPLPPPRPGHKFVPNRHDRPVMRRPPHREPDVMHRPPQRDRRISPDRPSSTRQTQPSMGGNRPRPSMGNRPQQNMQPNTRSHQPAMRTPTPRQGGGPSRNTGPRR